jgi:hypothetical protein
MQKFIISLKEKQTGRDVMPPYIVNSLDGLGNYSERVSPMGFVVIVDSIKEEDSFIELFSENPIGENNDFAKLGIENDKNIKSDEK